MNEERRSGREAETEALLRSVAKAVKPDKAGRLAKASLSRLLVYLGDRHLTGSLWLYDNAQDSTVTVVRGAPAKVRSTLPVPPLGDILVELGYVDAHASRETFAFAERGGGLHGAMLMACGLLDRDGLEAGLREQTARRLIQLFHRVGPSTRFAFYGDVDLLAAWGGVEVTPIDPWWLLWAGSRDRGVDDSVREVLRLFGQERVILHEDANLDRFGFDDAERALLSWWSGRAATVDMILAHPAVSKTRVAHMINVLFLTHNLSYDDVAAARSVKAAQTTAAPPEPPRRKPSAHGRARMAKSFQSVIEPVDKQREEPATDRKHTHSELDLSRCSEALKLSKRAQDALDRHAYEQAEKLAASALSLLPNNAAVKTEYAWVASHLPARRKIGDMGDLIDMLNQATESEPALDRAYFVRGTIFEYLGLHEQAYAEYRAAFTRNRRNVEAAERLREYVRRVKETGSPDPGGGGKRGAGKGISAQIAKLWGRR